MSFVVGNRNQHLLDKSELSYVCDFFVYRHESFILHTYTYITPELLVAADDFAFYPYSLVNSKLTLVSCPDPALSLAKSVTVLVIKIVENQISLFFWNISAVERAIRMQITNQHVFLHHMI